jgi:hypothetical protein
MTGRVRHVRLYRVVRIDGKNVVIKPYYGSVKDLVREEMPGAFAGLMKKPPKVEVGDIIEVIPGTRLVPDEE